MSGIVVKGLRAKDRCGLLYRSCHYAAYRVFDEKNGPKYSEYSTTKVGSTTKGRRSKAKIYCVVQTVHTAYGIILERLFFTIQWRDVN